MKNSLGSFLKQKGVSKSKLAREVGITRQTVIRITKGYPPTLKNAYRISRYFNKQVSDLFFD